jgi:hypothetical protein
MSASPVHADSFTRVSTALLAVWPSVADPSAGLSKAEMGRVLDECGSDYRPLVDLLVDLGRAVRPALGGLSPQAPSDWVHTRAPVVHRLVSTRYLQPDVARWAVDVWGRALGVAPVQPVAAPTVALPADDFPAGSPETAGSGAASPAAANRGGATRAPTARPPVLTPQQLPPALRQVPSWAGGPVSFRVGQKPKAATLAQLAQSGRVVVRAPVAPGPMFQPAERRAAVVLGALLVVITLALMNALRGREEGTEAAVVAAGVMEGATRTSARALNAPAVTAPAVTAPAETAPSVTAPSVTAPSVTAPGGGARIAVRDVGVGGRYVITHRLRDVSGSESCDVVARALAARRAVDETVSHAPGQPTFTLVTSRVTGTLDSDGLFVSEPRAGTKDNVRWRFRMSGRFGPEGFTGESVTHTDAILRWGKIQTCVITNELTGRRLLN